MPSTAARSRASRSTGSALPCSAIASAASSMTSRPLPRGRRCRADYTRHHSPNHHHHATSAATRQHPASSHQQHRTWPAPGARSEPATGVGGPPSTRPSRAGRTRRAPGALHPLAAAAVADDLASVDVRPEAQREPHQAVVAGRSQHRASRWWSMTSWSPSRPSAQPPSPSDAAACTGVPAADAEAVVPRASRQMAKGRHPARRMRGTNSAWDLGYTPLPPAGRHYVCRRAAGCLRGLTRARRAQDPAQVVGRPGRAPCAGASSACFPDLCHG